MPSDLTLPAILLAGLLSFLSPCVLPLVPPYLSFLAGASVREMTDGAGDAGLRRRALLTALCFVLGFSTVFVALGAGASLIGAVLRSYSAVLAQVAGVAIILMGLHFLGLFRFTFLMREARVQVNVAGGGAMAAYGMGMAFAFGWTPCIGPVLAGVLAVAGSEASVARGAGLLALYSAGLGIPFLLAALMMEPFTRFLARFRHAFSIVEKAMGVLLVLTGIAFLTGSISQFGFYLLEMFPVLGKLG